MIWWYHRVVLQIREAAERLGVAPITVRRMLRRQELGHVRIGRKRVLIEEREVEDYIARRRVPAAGPSGGRAA